MPMEQDGCRSRIVKCFTSNDDVNPCSFSTTTMTDTANDDSPTLAPNCDESPQRLPPTPPSPEELEGSGEKTRYRSSGTLSTMRNTRFLQISRARGSVNVKSRKSPLRPRYVCPCRAHEVLRYEAIYLTAFASTTKDGRIDCRRSQGAQNTRHEEESRQTRSNGGGRRDTSKFTRESGRRIGDLSSARDEGSADQQEGSWATLGRQFGHRPSAGKHGCCRCCS